MTAADITFAGELARPQEESQLAVVWRRFRRHRLAVAGLIIATFLVTTSFIGPVLSPYDATTIPTDLAACRNLPPMSTCPDGFHLLGTDQSGRDYATRLMKAGRVTIALAILVTMASQIVGTIVGGISGYFGGWLDSLLMRTVDFLLTLPLLPLLVVVKVLIPPSVFPFGGSVGILGVVLVIFGWMGTSRLVRGMVLSLRSQEFTEAARALGASDWRIIRAHMLPNSMAPVIVTATLSIGGVVVLEAALSFLGFGVQPPQPSWGNMLNGVQHRLLTNPYEVFYPGMAIFLTSLSFNFIGDALRDALDPRLKL